jgi:sigma-B regulation protein RsbU (phosphoserine phosphatase)
MEEMFQPFRRGQRSEETIKNSLGLGLFIVREIVRAHEGEIEVSSTAEAGTVFRITLPNRTELSASAK